MRILHVIPYYLPAVAFGGPVTICATLGQDLVKRGHSVTVLTTDVASRDGRVSDSRSRVEGVDVVRLRNVSQRLAGRANCYTPWGMARALDALLPSIDVCHVFDYFTWLTFRSIERSARRGIPTVLSPQGSMSLAPERGRTFVKTAMQRTLGAPTIARADVLHAVTNEEARVMQTLGARPEQIRVIPNGVDIPAVTGDGARFRVRHQVKADRIVLFVGRLLAGKGVDLLLEVARRWRADRSTIFALVGPAENRPDLARPGWLTDNVLLTGLQHGEGLEDAYAAATIFALPSYSEGLPMTALEAAARTLPCVLSRACNLPELEAGGGGVTVDCTSDDLERGIRTLLGRDTADIGRHARAVVTARFGRAFVHQRIEAVYRELVQSQGATS